MAQKVKTFLWMGSGAEEAAMLYTSLIANSQITSKQLYPTGTEQDGDVMIVEFTLGGVEYLAMNAKGCPAPNEAYSFSVQCENQAEIDRLWDALVDGGSPIHCGWLRDKFGFCWQIVPNRMAELLAQGNEAQRSAVMGAMMQMVKFDIAGLETAFESAAS